MNNPVLNSEICFQCDKLLLNSHYICLTEALLLSPDPKQYVWVCQGVTVVDNMDDGEELQLTDVSL